MQFQPVSDEQLETDAEERKRKAQPWPAGEYDYEVKAAEETTSKIKPDGSGGNPMIVLNVEVFKDGESKFINDYLLESTPEKLKRAAYACGLGAQYESGNLQPFDFEGRTGVLTLRIRRDVGYNPKNEIAGYIVSGANGDALAASVKPPLSRAELDDEIPF